MGLQPDDRSFALEVYPVLSFSSTGGAVATYNRMSDAAKAALLPLPPLSSRHATPDAFGEPLDFGNWSNSRDLFLHVFPRKLTMLTRRAVSLLFDHWQVFFFLLLCQFKQIDPPLIMPFSVLFRIDSYRQHLISTTSTHNHDDQPHPSRNGRSGDEQGRFNPPHGQTGGWEEQAASGVTSVTSSPTMIDDGGGLGEKAAGAGL